MELKEGISIFLDGVTPHSRVGTTLKAELAEAAAGMSYEAATVDISRYNPALKVSRQTVSLSVKEFNPKTEPLPQIKRQVSELYIEADEEHVKIKGRKGGVKNNLKTRGYIFCFSFTSYALKT